MALRDGINSNRVAYSAEQIGSKTNVDPKAIDKAITQMGPGLLESLGPAVAQYLRSCGEAVFNLGDRMQESSFRSLFSQGESPTPYQAKWFTARDTSSALPYEGRLPFNEVSLENLQKAVKSGLLTREQGQALAYMFGFANPPESQGLRTQSSNMQGGQGQGQSGERGMQQDHQGSGQNPDEEWNEMNLDEIGGGGGGGLGTTGKAMTGTGGGPPPPPPGGGAFPGGPPPPPPGSSGTSTAGKNQDYSGMINQGMQQEYNYLNANFTPGDPYYSSFQIVFNSENWYRNFSAQGLTELQKIRDAKSAVMAELAGIDASSPQGAKKLYILQQKMGEMQQSERQIYDHISTAQKANNERKELVKSILDMIFQTSSALIRNIGK